MDKEPNKNIEKETDNKIIDGDEIVPEEITEETDNQIIDGDEIIPEETEEIVPEETTEEINNQIVDGDEIIPEETEEFPQIEVEQETKITFNPNPIGSKVTKPSEYYTTSKNEGNVWIRQSETENNSDRVVMLQFSNDLFISQEKTLMDKYYDKLYEVREGYDRPKDFWEIPMWQSNIKATINNCDSYIVRSIKEAINFMNNTDYKMYLFSVLDINKDYVKELATTGKNIGVGGYTNMNYFEGINNIKVFEDVESLAKDLGQPYVAGSDYSMFKGTKTIPRLQMSTGCLHHCAFCCVPNTVIDKPQEYIAQQIESMVDLDAKLIYIDDKTFGQARSYKFLKDMYKLMKSHKPDFEGFIIQTTALMMKKLDADFLAESGIKYIELGIESYNDYILKKYKKPANEKIIDEAVEKIRNAGINFIPNLIIGFPEETKESYQKTINFLKKNEDIISHFNVYNLAVYEGTDLQEMLDAKFDDNWDDRNENNLNKSWYEGTDIHNKFNDYIYNYGLKVLDKKPYSKTIKKTNKLKRDLIKYILN